VGQLIARGNVVPGMNHERAKPRKNLMELLILAEMCATLSVPW